MAVVHPQAGLRETITRVIRHLGATEVQIAMTMGVSHSSLYSKLHVSGTLRDTDIAAIAKALRLPQKVLKMPAIDAIQFLLDKEKAAS